MEIKKEELIVRDHLALERTKMANERTLLAYIRTSLYLFIGGIATIQIKGFDRLKFIGIIALILAGSFIIIGIIRYHKLNKKIRKSFYSAPN